MHTRTATVPGKRMWNLHTRFMAAQAASLPPRRVLSRRRSASRRRRARSNEWPGPWRESQRQRDGGAIESLAHAERAMGKEV